MLKTGEICTESGYYKCNAHTGYLVYIDKGNEFPECSRGPNGSHTTIWGPARKVSLILSELKASLKSSAESLKKA